MRERQIPCFNASPDEALSNRHMTFNLRYCDRCLDISRGVRVQGSLKPSSASPPAVSAPAASSQDALHPRSGSTFGDFLSVGRQVSRSEQRGDALSTAAPLPSGPAHPLRGQQSVNPSYGSAAHPRT